VVLFAIALCRITGYPRCGWPVIASHVVQRGEVVTRTSSPPLFGKAQDVDAEIIKGLQSMQRMNEMKEKKTARKLERHASQHQRPLSSRGRPAGVSRSSPSAERDQSQLLPRDSSAINVASQTIWGQNIINCRSFSLEGPKTCTFLGSYMTMQSAPVWPLPEIAFVGRSNVGKSSMLNMLTGQNKKVAVESKTPGRTQSINMFKCEDREGDICAFVDLPGYGYAKMAKDKQETISHFLVDYLANRSSLRLVVLLIDIRRDIQQMDVEMISYMESEDLDYIVVATKSDKLSKADVDNSIDKLTKGLKVSSGSVIPVSSVTGE
jgi:GTP-binding protein